MVLDQLGLNWGPNGRRSRFGRERKPYSGFPGLSSVAGDEGEGLADVLGFEFRTVSAEVVPIGGDGQCFDDVADGKTHTSNSGWRLMMSG